MLNWVKQFNIFCYLDNQQYHNEDGYECLLAVGAANYIDGSSPFSEIDQFITHANDWCFGHLSYSLKNQFYPGVHHENDQAGFPAFFFFQPLILVQIKGNDFIIRAKEPHSVYEAIVSSYLEDIVPETFLKLSQRLEKEAYTGIIKKRAGDKAGRTAR